MSRLELTVKLLRPGARLPAKAHPTDAGFDLATPAAVSIDPLSRVLVPLGLAVAVPEGWYGQIQGRSGNASQRGVQAFPGVVDHLYCGEVGVVLFNSTARRVTFSPGDRVAQLLILPVPAVEVVEVGELAGTGRGIGGFGSHVR
jgi:dUTP pyrophosphatase